MLQMPQAQSVQAVPTVTVHMPNVQSNAGTPVKGRRPDSGRESDPGSQNWLAAEKDTSLHSMSFSEEVEVANIQPVRSVTVSKKSGEFSSHHEKLKKVICDRSLVKKIDLKDGKMNIELTPII